jgi:hypothetical protein
MANSFRSPEGEEGDEHAIGWKKVKLIMRSRGRTKISAGMELNIESVTNFA